MNISGLIKKMKSKTVKDDASTEKVAYNVNGYIDYSAGLWLSGWVSSDLDSGLLGEDGYSDCILAVNGHKIYEFSADIVRSDLQVLPDLAHGRGFNIQIPAQRFSEVLDEYESIEFSIFLGGKKIPHIITEKSVDIYGKVFSELFDDTNKYIEILPLFNQSGLAILSAKNKIFLIDVLISTGLYRERDGLLTELIKSIQVSAEELAESRDLLDILRYKNEFLTKYLTIFENDLFTAITPLSNLVISTLKTLPYLQTMEIARNSFKEKANIERLNLLCTQNEEVKFKFIETIPDSREQALELWEQLDNETKREYWPLVAGTLQFKNRHEELKLISVGIESYTNGSVEAKSRIEELRSVIGERSNQWFAFSFIVQAAVSDEDQGMLSELLKEFSWKIWDMDFFDLDSFGFVSNRLIEKGLDASSYDDVCDAYSCILNYLKEKDLDTLHRKTFVVALVNVINYGIENQLNGYTALEKLARPYLSLTNTFSQNINLEPLKYSNYTEYSLLKGFYRKTESIRRFFLRFDADSNYLDIEIVEILQKLLKLKRKYGIEDIDPKLLALSRYCQLTERKQMFPLLKSIHAEMGDYYSALNLEEDEVERKALVQRITEHGDNAKRVDSFWFSEALRSRLDIQGEASREFLVSINSYLLVSEDKGNFVNPDLAELMVSECLLLAKKGFCVDSVLEIIAGVAEVYAKDSYNALKLYLLLTKSALLSGKGNVEAVNEIEQNLGSIGVLRSILDSLELPVAHVYSESERALFLPRIEQCYIYPYTKVLIYSCNKYENTRHSILRSTWVNDLKKYDIDYAFVVGDSKESHIVSDKMYLKVLDTYEELPKKSLEMFRFSLKSSNHRYFFKIDDDCILNVDAMFSDPSYLGVDYFGRVVTRPLGGVDRTWHHLKSASEKAKQALDLSPEYSTYCDGSTGYILSRDAIKKLNYEATNPVNSQLISASYFEDKLIGDLLAKAQIEGVSRGYNTVIRRSIAGDRDVQIWKHGLLPNSEINIKVLHTEDDEFRLKYYKNLHSDKYEVPRLLYRDINSDMEPSWLPSNEKSPLLETIRVDESAIRNASVVAIIVGKNEQEFLPGLLSHHRKLGVEHFLFVDNVSSDQSIDYMLNQEDVSVFVATQDYKYSRFGVNWQETLCSHYCLGKWTLIIDSDELFMFDGFENRSLQELTRKAEMEGANAVFSPMVDFYPKGQLDNADVTKSNEFYRICSYFDSIETMNILAEERFGPYGNSKVFSGGLRERIFGRYNSYPAPNYLNQKYNLIKYLPSMRLIEGLHFMHGHKVSSISCGIMHFKYHSGFHEKVMREVKSGQHWNGAKEYHRYLELLRGGENVTIYEEGKSLEYNDSSSLVKAGYISPIEWSE